MLLHVAWQKSVEIPSSGFKNISSKQKTERTIIAAFSLHYLTLKMEAVHSFKISVSFHQTKWRNTPEYRTFFKG
jgi:hypothetical protein